MVVRLVLVGTIAVLFSVGATAATQEITPDPNAPGPPRQTADPSPPADSGAGDLSTVYIGGAAVMAVLVLSFALVRRRSRSRSKSGQKTRELDGW